MDHILVVTGFCAPIMQELSFVPLHTSFAPHLNKFYYIGISPLFNDIGNSAIPYYSLNYTIEEGKLVRLDLMILSATVDNIK